MKRLDFALLCIPFFLTLFLSISCSGNSKLNKDAIPDTTSDQYTIYIINYSFHTGIIIPIEDRSIKLIRALDNFKNYRFADIGWGEEYFYQNPDDNYCMAAKAILLPNPSVIRIEGYSSLEGSFICWSNFTVKLMLSADQFKNIAQFIDRSFKTDVGSNYIITSKNNSGDTVFFKSIYRYHLFNTCNTWVAGALHSSGMDISPSFIITAGQLYDEIKDKGEVIKSMK